MSQRAPIEKVIAWLKANPDVSKAEAARLHGWHPVTLRGNLRGVDLTPVASVANESVGQSPKTIVRTALDLPSDVRGLLKTAMTRRLELLATGELGKPKDEAVIFGILVDKYPDALRIDSDGQDTSNIEAEAKRIAATYLAEDEDTD